MEVTARLEGPLLTQLPPAVVPHEVDGVSAVWAMVFAGGGGKLFKLVAGSQAGLVVDAYVAGTVAGDSYEGTKQLRTV